MHIESLNLKEFEDFVKRNPLGNPYQTHEYANLMKENGFDCEYIGLKNTDGIIIAVSLILIKKLTKFLKYGYAPKGFILDYFNEKILEEFTFQIIKYFKNKLVFIKINPEVAIAEVNPKTGQKKYNQNIQIKNRLINLGYIKLKDNLYFESQLPRYNAIVNLKNFSLNKVTKNTRNKIKRGMHKGLEIELAEYNKMDILYNFVKKKRNKEIYYYRKYYRTLKKSHNIDLFLVKINTQIFFKNAKESYKEEKKYNKLISNQISKNSNNKYKNVKMNSERKLLAYKNDVLEAQNKVNKGESIYIAGALVIKYKNRINVVISGYDTNYKRFNPNYFLHYKILEYYKKEYNFADLNGITGDFSKSNPYYGLNQFKLGFKPKVYEFIGEYDLAIQSNLYKLLLKSGKLAKIFNKKDIKF